MSLIYVLKKALASCRPSVRFVLKELPLRLRRKPKMGRGVAGFNMDIKSVESGNILTVTNMGTNGTYPLKKEVGEVVWQGVIPRHVVAVTLTESWDLVADGRTCLLMLNQRYSRTHSEKSCVVAAAISVAVGRVRGTIMVGP
tara:strand:+ start:69157 stop:69582 length:426 start_codon:yes stop_codon:yes gene_type:complete